MNLEATKDNQLKVKEIEFLTKENEYKSNLNYMFLIVILLVLIILYFIYYRYKVKQKQNLILEKIVEERTQELRVSNEKIQNSLDKEREINDLKSNIILNISHQFRTPLTAISSYLEIIKLKNSDHPELEKPIDNSLKATIELSKLSDKELNHIFEPLFVGKKHVGLKSGNGFGLTIAKSNIELLNGTLIINSQESQGTISTIIL